MPNPSQGTYAILDSSHEIVEPLMKLRNISLTKFFQILPQDSHFVQLCSN
ncbi:hypothetical protein Hdeb2414_s0002g00078801 [Helianthus debilis subsp. tardiflorus]